MGPNKKGDDYFFVGVDYFFVRVFSRRSVNTDFNVNGYIVRASVSIDGCMTCDFTSFSTVFQSYQDDGRVIMEGFVQWNPVCN